MDLADSRNKRHKEAEALYREMIETQKHVLGPDHPPLAVIGELGCVASCEYQPARDRGPGTVFISLGGMIDLDRLLGRSAGVRIHGFARLGERLLQPLTAS